VATVADAGTEQEYDLAMTPSRSTKRKRGLLGSSKGEIVMSEDFDAPLEDFQEYMEPNSNREAFIEAVKISRAEFERGDYKRGSVAEIMREALENNH
jgi:hypothetical protein